MTNIKWLFSSIGAVLIMGVAAASGQTFLTNGLIAYYPFNGNANDAVGINNGTVVGASLASDRFGNTNHAYAFNGATYIHCPDTGLPSGNSPRTVSLWLKATSFTVTYPFSYGVDGATNAFYLIMDNVDSGAPYFAVGKSGGGSTPQWHGPTTNVWYQLVVTYSNSTASLFVNGSNLMQASRTYGTTLAGNFFIGSYLGGGPPTFYGVISDVRIYNRALSSQEVSELYATESVVSGITLLSTITIQGIAGKVYEIEYKNDISSTNWTVLATNIVASNGIVLYPDTNAFNQPKRFYEVIPE
jgi:hypothetical protein